MDSLEYQEYLESLSASKLQDYIEEIHSGHEEITEEEADLLKQHLDFLKINKIEKYFIVWGLLMALTAVSGPLLDVVEDNLEKPELPDYDPPSHLVWVTHGSNICQECAYLDGKIYQVDTDRIPPIHPNCKCEFERKYVAEGEEAMKSMKMGYKDGGAVRAFTRADGTRILDVLAAPFGSPDNLDGLGQFLSVNTDFMVIVGDRRPTLYLHGYSPQQREMRKPSAIGIATVSKVDRKGLWMRTTLDDSELSNRVWDAALEGKARASTGSVNYLVRPQDMADGSPTPGEVVTWPIAELSVFDIGQGRTPVSNDAVVLPLRAIFKSCEIELPKGFEAGEDKDPVTIDSLRSNISSSNEDIEMDEKELALLVAKITAAQAEAAKATEAQKVALRAELKLELEAEHKKLMKDDPKYRATFNVNTIDDKEAKKKVETEENFAYMRGLIEDGKRVFSGGMPIAHRVLEESEALELGPMVPTDLASKIHTFRGKYSLVRKSGMFVYQTDKLTFSIPAETTAMAIAPTIAEEGAYVANEAAFAAKPVTMLKKGSLIAVTEEALEDQDLFQQWIAKACGKSLALAENFELNALTTAIAGVEVAATHTLTDAELLAGYFALPQENRDEAVWIMNDGTLAYIRAMLVATPRAYGEFGFLNGSMGELGETLMNHRVFTNANWDSIATAADDVKIIDFVDLDQCIAWVERRGLSIFVDPYSTRASAGTINYMPSARFAGVTVDSTALSGIDDHV